MWDIILSLLTYITFSLWWPSVHYLTSGTIKNVFFGAGEIIQGLGTLLCMWPNWVPSWSSLMVSCALPGCGPKIKEYILDQVQGKTLAFHAADPCYL